MKTPETDFLARLQRLYTSPWLFLFSIALFFISGFCALNFESAMTPEEAILQGYPPMPTEWEAGVFNHGEYIHWLTIEKHPTLYMLSLVTFCGALIVLVPRLVIIIMKIRHELGYLS